MCSNCMYYTQRQIYFISTYTAIQEAPLYVVSRYKRMDKQYRTYLKKHIHMFPPNFQ